MNWPFKKKEVEEKVETKIPTFEDEKERSRFSNVVADIEKLKALIKSLDERRKVDGEKFTRLNEQIGELRTSSVEREKQLRDIEISSLKAVEMVKEVHPEKLMTEVKKGDMKLIKLESYMEKYETTLAQFIEEIKEIRTKMELFRGYEELLKLNQETRQEVSNMKKLEIKMDIHTNKVERLFIDFQKKYQEFEEFKQLGDYMQEIYRTVIKEINALKVKSTNFIEKEAIRDLEKDTLEKTEKVDEFLKRKDMVIEPTIAKLIQRVQSQDQELHQINENIENIQNQYSKLYTYITKLLKSME